jgi:hypothetical protein
MLDTSVAPKNVGMSWKLAGLREVFGDNASDINLPVHENSHEHQNELLLEASVGGSRADLTAAGREKKKRDNSEHKEKQNPARSISCAPGNNSLSDNPFLKGVRLDDEHMVSTNDDNILMVRGEGPDAELREMRIGEKNQIEDTSQMNTGYVTQDEVEMNAYLRGETDVLPEALKDLAEKNGHVAEDVSRDEFQDMVTEGLPANIALRVNDNVPLVSGGLTANSPSLLPPPPSPETTVTPSAPAPILPPPPMI